MAILKQEQWCLAVRLQIAHTLSHSALLPKCVEEAKSKDVCETHAKHANQTSQCLICSRLLQSESVSLDAHCWHKIAIGHLLQVASWHLLSAFSKSAGNNNNLRASTPQLRKFECQGSPFDMQLLHQKQIASSWAQRRPRRLGLV